jgi:indolepyruvate ferredoxin oxidoreductase, beta subunit
MTKPTNVTIAGLGGQGVILASDILATVAFRAGLDVKKAEIHGMSQRGGSVSTDVRFGAGGGEVLSPMIPAGESDFLLVLSTDQIEVNRPALKRAGTLITPDSVPQAQLPNKRTLNIALLGVLSQHLSLPVELWHAVIQASLPERLHDLNLQAFTLGRTCAQVAAT